jgi:hypothetical protein
MGTSAIKAEHPRDNSALQYGPASWHQQTSDGVQHCRSSFQGTFHVVVCRVDTADRLKPQLLAADISVLTVLRLRPSRASSPCDIRQWHRNCCACAYNRSVVVLHRQLKDWLDAGGIVQRCTNGTRGPVSMEYQSTAGTS